MPSLITASASFVAPPTPPRPSSYMPHTPVKTNPAVFLDITADEEHLGRVTIELFADNTPKTAENFRSLCTGERGRARWVPKPGATCPLWFKGIPFHRIVSGFVMQGGDVLFRDGRGSESIYGYQFPDECFSGKAREHLPGTIAMATAGRDRCGSQFFFNLKRSSHLDGKFVVFGQVVDGWDAIVNASALAGSRCGTPTCRVWISDCGQCGVAGIDHDVERAQFSMPGKEVLDLLRPR